MNINDKSEFILTLSCPDTFGIVAEVASFMSEQGLTIKESNQFGDTETDTFFMTHSKHSYVSSTIISKVTLGDKS